MSETEIKITYTHVLTNTVNMINKPTSTLALLQFFKASEIAKAEVYVRCHKTSPGIKAHQATQHQCLPRDPTETH